MGFVILLFFSIICGFISEDINNNRGLTEKYNGFAWGFWFNIFGVLIVALRPRE